ncbi:MAG: hypothetical protein AAFW46_16300 [Pseudomonadota bacterium]
MLGLTNENPGFPPIRRRDASIGEPPAPIQGTSPCGEARAARRFGRRDGGSDENRRGLRLSRRSGEARAGRWSIRWPWSLDGGSGTLAAIESTWTRWIEEARWIEGKTP